MLPFKWKQAIEGMEAILNECWKLEKYQLDGNGFFEVAGAVKNNIIVR